MKKYLHKLIKTCQLKKKIIIMCEFCGRIVVSGGGVVWRWSESCVCLRAAPPPVSQPAESSSSSHAGCANQPFVLRGPGVRPSQSQLVVGRSFFPRPPLRLSIRPGMSNSAPARYHVDQALELLL